jgi:hypothetical protein
MRATELGVNLTERQWNDLGVNLMQRDFAYRQNYAAMPDMQDRVINLPVQDIAQYHADTFTAFGLDSKAWTAYIPLTPYLSRGDYSGAENVWSTMMNPSFYKQVGGTLYADAVETNSENWSDHLMWAAKAAALSASYATDPRQAYNNPDKIGTFNHDDQGWYQIDNAPPEYRMGNPRQYLLPSAAADLDRARNFRLERLQMFSQRVGLDQSPIINSR